MANIHPPHEELKADVLAYCASKDVSKTLFGIKAVKDPRFVSDLEQGRQPRWDTIERVRQYMRDNA